MSLLFQALASGLIVGAVYALIAVGFSLVLGTLKVVDFAYGSYVLLGAYLTYWLSVTVFAGGEVVHAVLSIVVAAAATAAFASLLWGVAMRSLLDKSHMSQLVATLGVSVAISGALIVLFGSSVVATQFPAAQKAIQIGPIFLGTGRVAAGAVGVVMLFAIMGFLASRLGMMIRAVALDVKGAAVIGIPIMRVRIATVGLAAALGGLAGGLLILFLPVGPSDAMRFLLIAFFTVAVGGLGSLKGALLAAFLIALVESISQNFIPNVVSNAMPFLVVAFLIALVPRGIGSLALLQSRRTKS